MPTQVSRILANNLHREALLAHPEDRARGRTDMTACSGNSSRCASLAPQIQPGNLPSEAPLYLVVPENYRSLNCIEETSALFLAFQYPGWPFAAAAE
jgi:hypothetical protein